MQCATSKLADAVDTDRCREMDMLIIVRNEPFLKSVPFPLKVGRGLSMELKGRLELKGRKESSVCLRSKRVGMSV